MLIYSFFHSNDYKWSWCCDGYSHLYVISKGIQVDNTFGYADFEKIKGLMLK